MDAKEKILAALKQNQPPHQPLPSLGDIKAIRFDNAVEKFTAVLQGIGGKVVDIQSMNDIHPYLLQHFTASDRYVTTIHELPGVLKVNPEEDGIMLDGVEVGVLAAKWGVAENGAVWVTEDDIKIRVFPFICQHLAVVLKKRDILHNMHEAYEKIGMAAYGFGVFIAGPSKTADIEQSLVLGAHGPKSMTVFLME